MRRSLSARHLRCPRKICRLMMEDGSPFPSSVRHFIQGCVPELATWSLTFAWHISTWPSLTDHGSPFTKPPFLQFYSTIVILAYNLLASSLCWPEASLIIE